MSDQLEHLTEPERWLLDRRRRGESQTQTAHRLGITRTRYNMLERSGLQIANLHPADITIDELSPGERCLLYRRRCNLTQADVARELAVSRYWVNRQERDAVAADDLLGYWEN